MDFTIAQPVYVEFVVRGFSEPAPDNMYDDLTKAGCVIQNDVNKLPCLRIMPAAPQGLRIHMLAIIPLHVADFLRAFRTILDARIGCHVYEVKYCVRATLVEEPLVTLY